MHYFLPYIVCLLVVIGPSRAGFSSQSLVSEHSYALGCIPLTGISMSSTLSRRHLQATYNCTSTCTNGNYVYAVEFDSGTECICTDMLDVSQMAPSNSEGSCPDSTYPVTSTGVILPSLPNGSPTASNTPTISSGASASPSTTTTSAPAATYTSLGCFAEPRSHSMSDTALCNYTSGFSEHMSVDACVSQCASMGLPLAGVEFGAICNCADGIYNGGYPVGSGHCSAACAGDEWVVCGGTWVFNLYANETFIETLRRRFPMALAHRHSDL